MSLPAGVSIAPDQPLSPVSQRGYFTPPFVSCMFATACDLLEHAGYRLPLAKKRANTPPENFVWAMHMASGAALDRGTTVRHTQIALRKLLPDAPILFGKLTPDEILAELAAGAAIRVIVKAPRLPGNLGRWLGDFTGLHAMTLKEADGSGRVLVLDPMGRRKTGYMGQWVRFADLLPAIKRTDSGDIAATLAYRNAAVPVEPAPTPEPVPEPVPEPDWQALYFNTIELLAEANEDRDEALLRLAVLDDAAGQLMAGMAAAVQGYMAAITEGINE